MTLDGNTLVYGIFGYPVKHSKSPTFQTAAFQHLNINAVYVPFQVKPEDIEKAVESLRALDIKGVNVTIPHKENVIPYLNEISEEVKIIKAVKFVEVKLKGDGLRYEQAVMEKIFKSLDLPFSIEFVDSNPFHPKPDQPTPCQTNPNHPRPLHTRPAQTTPSQSRPLQLNPFHSKPTQTNPGHSNPVHTKPSHSKGGD
jgi:hypothetical protein